MSKISQNRFYKNENFAMYINQDIALHLIFATFHISFNILLNVSMLHKDFDHKDFDILKITDFSTHWKCYF